MDCAVQHIITYFSLVSAIFLVLRSTRGKATGLTTMMNWGATTIVGALFPMASTASLPACFFFFAAAITVGTLVVYFFQPETAYKTSKQIDEAYRTHKPKLIRKQW